MNAIFPIMVLDIVLHLHLHADSELRTENLRPRSKVQSFKQSSNRGTVAMRFLRCIQSSSIN